MDATQRPLCEVPSCAKIRVYLNTINPYCEMHKARFRRNGHFGLRDKTCHKLEKLPHTVDQLIRENAHRLLDRQIAEQLLQQGYSGATRYTVGRRRRKLGIRKYDFGEKRKHKAWIRQQALRKYGHRCELCSYSLYVETHHITPIHKGGPHEIENLMIVCSNCHTLLTRRRLKLSKRSEIPSASCSVLEIYAQFIHTWDSNTSYTSQAFR